MRSTTIINSREIAFEVYVDFYENEPFLELTWVEDGVTEDEELLLIDFVNTDDRLLAAALEDAGYIYSGHPNDPDGGWQHVS